MKYAWQSVPNEHIQVLHVDIRLPYISSFGHNEEKLDEEDKEFAKNLRDIDGVASISMLKGYECQIEKAELFEWNQLEEEILECFRRRYKPHGKLINAGRRESIKPSRSYDDDERDW